MMTISELAVLAGRGDETSCEELLQRLTPLIGRTAEHFEAFARRRHIWREDLMQSGYVGVLEALSGFDPSRGGFYNYISPYISVSIKRTIGLRSIQPSPETRGDMLSIDAEDGDFLLRHECIGRQEAIERLEQCEIRAAVNEAIERLPPELKAAAIGRLRGVPTKKSARPALRRAFRRLEHDKCLRRLWRSYNDY